MSAYVEVTSVYGDMEIYLNLDYVESMSRSRDETYTSIWIHGDGDAPTYMVRELPNEILARTRRC